MNKNSKIYIAGHTGFIGSVVLAALKKGGYKNLICTTRNELNLTNQEKVNAFFKRTKPEYVFLLAARVGGIYANSMYPAEFIYQNLEIEMNIFHAAHIYDVKKLIFPGSACMYPKVCPQPMKEAYLLGGPLEPTNEPFAVAKIAGIKMCQAYNRQYKSKYICCIPATVYGPGDHFGVNGHVVASLIERIHKAKISGKKEAVVWGSGKPKREFIHVYDLAEALIFLMRNYSASGIVNIGTETETSVKDLAFLIKSITGFKGRLIFDTTQPDGNARRPLDSRIIKELGWKANISLIDGLRSLYKWYNIQLKHKKEDGK
jgi:GDP-L-fucose synthase